MKIHPDKSRVTPAVLVSLLLLFMCRPSLAMDYYGSAGMVVSMDVASFPEPTKKQFSKKLRHKKLPEFFVLDNNNTKYPLEKVAEYNHVYQAKIPSDLPTGIYRIYAKFMGTKALIVNYNMQINPPHISDLQITNESMSPEMSLDGLYFGQDPSVTLIYKDVESGVENHLQGAVLPTSYTFLDPYQEGSQKNIMDTASGKSKLDVRFPPFSVNGPTEAILRVRSDSGFTDYVLVVSGNSLVEPAPKRGQLISSSFLDEWRYDKVQNKIIDAMVGPGSGFMHFVQRHVVESLFLENESPETYALLQEVKYQNTGYNVRLWKVEYWTQLMNGKPVKASGVIALPVKVRPGPSDPNPGLVMYLHGTMLKKTDAPSFQMGAEMGLSTLYAAGWGQIVAVPDHLGLGDATLSKSYLSIYHPYCQWEPNARTDGDMIPAIRQLLANNAFEPNVKRWKNNKLYLAGYSEGGYLALGLHLELERNPKDYGFLEGAKPVTASTPMEGPYSLSNIMVDKLLEKNPFPVPYFAPYLLVTLNDRYQFASDSEYLSDEGPDYYRRTIPPLVNGLYSDRQLNSSMPAKVSEVLTDAARQELTEKNTDKSKMYGAIAENDLVKLNLNTETPIVLIHGNPDDLVPYDNAPAMAKKLKQPGENDPLVTLKASAYQNTLYRTVGLSYHISFVVRSFGVSWSELRKH